MSELLEERTIYGYGRVHLTANVSQGGIYLQQVSKDHDLAMRIQISSIEGIERLEALLNKAKQQLFAIENDQKIAC